MGNYQEWKKIDSFWWKSITKLTDQYKGIAQVHVQNGASIIAWEDQW
jgi:hypothetical protein